MGLKKFQIIFDNPYATYYTGQPVRGHILLNVDSPKKIRALVVHFKGEASVKWHKEETERNSAGQTVQQTIPFTGHEQYFENKFNILGGGGNEVTIEPGEHQYPFTTYLPPNLPSSFEGEFGYVRYTIKVTLDRPWKFDQEAKAAFTVLSPLDLNTNDTAKNPVKIEKEETKCCCCCETGPITLVLSLPVGGYVPGQAIPVTVEVDNTSNTDVTKVVGYLRKMLVFKATSPSNSHKKDEIKIAEHVFGSVPRNGSNTWTEQLVIPPLPPSNLNNCNIIDLSYDLKIKVKLPGVYSDIVVTTPIILGTIPLINYQPPPPVMKEGNGEAAAGETGQGWKLLPQKDPNASQENNISQPTQWGPPLGPGGEPQPGYPQQPQWGQPPAGPPGEPQPGYPQPQWGQPPAGPPGEPQPGYPQQPQWGQPPAGPPGYPQPQWGQPPAGLPAESQPGYPQQPQWGQPPTGSPGNPQQSQWGQAPAGSPSEPQAGFQQPTNNAEGPNAPPASYPGQPQWGPSPGTQPANPLYPSIPPPAYAESLFGPKNIKEANDNPYTQGNMQFAPRYPVYTYQPQAPQQ